MSRGNRFDRLESEIVDALKRAPGATPSAELDARILARAHGAVATPKRRPQPIWFSMAAGLVVLVGSGLALRIWQQVEHAPSALDIPAATEGAPAKTAADAGAAADPARPSVADSAGIRAQLQHPERAASEVQSRELAPSAPMAASPAPEQQSLHPGRENLPAAAAKLESASGLVAPAVADELLDAARKPAAPRPFPAEPEPVVASAPATTLAIEQAPVREIPAQPPAAPPAAVAAAPLAAPAAAAPAAPADDLGPIDLDQTQSRPGADAASIAVTGALADGSEELAKRDRAEEAAGFVAAPGEDAAVDAYATALVAVRQAIAAGDGAQARRLMKELQHRFPERKLPEDLRIWAEQPR